MRTLRYLLLISGLMALPRISYSFKDVTPEVDKASSEFTEEGLFGPFIYQYGEDLFRPNGYVTRDNLILVLHEYHILTKKLINQNAIFSKKISALENKSISRKNMDMIIQEFQNLLDPMLENSSTIKSLKEDMNSRMIASSSVSGSAPSSDNSEDVEELEKKLEKLNIKIDNIAKMYAALNKKKSSGGSVSVAAEDIEDLKKEVEDINADISKQAKQIDSFHKNKYALDEDLDILGEEISNLNLKVMELTDNSSVSEKKLDSSSKSKKTVSSDTDIKVLTKEIKSLRKDIEAQKKEMDSINKGSGSVASAAGDQVMSLWAKLSIGFSTIALFFMAR